MFSPESSLQPSYGKVTVSDVEANMQQRPIYLGHDVPGYDPQLVKAISRYGLTRGAPWRWQTAPDFAAWDQLGYMQPSGGIYWQSYLYTELQAAGIDQCLDLSTITILEQRWHFGERNWRFAPGKIEYQVRRALKGLNYIVMIEFEVFRNVRYLEPLPPGGLLPHLDQGRVIAPHIQGLIWGGALSRRRRSSFSGGLFNAPSVKIIDVYDFAGALRYMAKPPHRGRSVFRLQRGGYGRRPWAKMSLTLHHLLLSNLHQFSYPDLTFAGGEGRAVLAQAKRLWRDYVPAARFPSVHRWPIYAGLVERKMR
jgi:hypothetical protein